jgi:hypothetical protein
MFTAWLQDNMSAIVVLLDSAPKAEAGFQAPETVPDPHELYPAKAAAHDEESDPPHEEANVRNLFGALQAMLVGRVGG